METIERIADMLNGFNREILCRDRDEIAEIRLRSNGKLRLNLMNGSEAMGELLDDQTFHRIINLLMDNSIYSRENELKQGYFTTSDGFRVGVCGKMTTGANGIDSLANIGSACIRVPREVVGCSGNIVELARKSGRYGILIISPPGLGKTTLMRDYIRTLSDMGMNICLADERREIACCREGVPQLQVGCRTDVLEGCPKSLALNMMIRSCAPDLVAADEIGSPGDAEALLEAARCGVAVAATAHGRSLEDILRRRHIAELVRMGVFDWCIFLGPGRGQILKILPVYAGKNGKVLNVQGDTVDFDSAFQYMCRQDAIQCAEKTM